MRPREVVSGMSLLVVVALITACSPAREADSVGCAMPTAPELISAATSDAPTKETGLAVSEDGHYLIDASGAPFVMQADSAWGLVNRGTKRDVIQYLDARQKQGFNTILLPAVYGF